MISREIFQDDTVVELEVGGEALGGTAHDVADETVRVDHARLVHLRVPARGIVAPDRDVVSGHVPVGRGLEGSLGRLALEGEVAAEAHVGRAGEAVRPAVPKRGRRRGEERDTNRGGEHVERAVALCVVSTLSWLLVSGVSKSCPGVHTRVLIGRSTRFWVRP